MNDMREIGSEYHMDPADGGEDLVSVLKCEAGAAGRGIRFLRCGRDALGFIADEIARKGAGAAGGCAARTLYIPALCCDSMVFPFAKRGWHIEYYRLKTDLSADTGHLCSLIDRAGAVDGAADGTLSDAVEVPAPVVLVMNYYGLVATDEVRRCIRERCHDAVIIEDVTHRVFSPSEFLNDDIPADYHIGSIRKWMGVTDGSFVTGPADMGDVADSADAAEAAVAPAGIVTDFTRLRRQALLEKRDYIFSEERPQALKDHFRGLFGEAEDSLEDGIHPMPMSDIAREILKSCDLQGMRARRRENFRVLRECLAADPLCGEMYEIQNPDAEIPDCPFMLPIVMHTDHIRESAHTAAGRSITRDRFENKLAARGVYAPVLWPIDAQAAEVCDVSRRFAQNMLAFYIDQRYDADDMRYAAEVFGDELRAMLG
ncbi:MAG: hypothetical protein K5673_05975 [Lachnospiraceae bacterium]|nr:hypothetical protein [Lachnospiraceae bacterium]